MEERKIRNERRNSSISSTEMKIETDSVTRKLSLNTILGTPTPKSVIRVLSQLKDENDTQQFEIEHERKLNEQKGEILTSPTEFAMAVTPITYSSRTSQLNPENNVFFN